jgi:hypothetical protein
MATRIDIVSGLNPIEANKMLCCEGCATNVTTFQNIHNTDLNVTTFNISDAGTGFSVSITAINGGAPTFPFFIAEGDTFTMEFEVCHVGPATSGTWAGYFDTVEHAPDTPFGFVMSCVNSSYFGFSPNPVNFIDAPVGIPTTQVVTSGNTFQFTQTLTLTPTGCSDVVVNPTSLLIVQDGPPPPFEVTWTPATVGLSLTCTIEDCSGVTVDLTGNSVETPCENCLCCVDVTIKTDGSYLPPQSGLCDDGAIYTTASFLEKKSIVFSLVYPSGIHSQWQLQFNPGLFLRLCDSPFVPGQLLPSGYTITYLSSLMPDGIAQPMALTGTGANSANRKNWECTFTPVNAALGTFQVELTFFNLQDLENFISPGTWDNLGKLTRNTISSPTNWTNTSPSVYNANKVISGAFMVVDPTLLDENFNFTRCQFVTCANYTARYYDKGLTNGPSEFIDPSWQLSRNIGPVSKLSTLEKTNVRFTITIPGMYGSGAPVCIYHLFDVTNINNTVDFLASTDSSRIRVLSYGGTGVLDNHLVRPGSVANVSGEWFFNLYVGTTVNPSSRYRMAAIVYDSDGTMVNTFLSPEWSVEQTPDFDCDCEVETISKWIQYWQQTISDSFRPAAKERIGHNMTIDAGAFGDCLANWGFSGDWRDLLSNVRLNVYKRESGFPGAALTTFFQFETHNSSRNTGFPGNYQNQNDMVVADNGTGGVDISILNRRVLWQNTPFQPGVVQTANTASYMNRVSAGGMTSTYITTTGTTQSWINEDVYFEYVFTFNLASIVGSSFLWNIVKAFPVNAIDFEPFSGFGNYLSDVAIYGRTSLTGAWTELTAPICFKDFAQIKLVYQADREGNFIFFAEPAPFGLPVLQENNEMTSPHGLTQLSSPLVVSMDTAFDPAMFTASVILNPALMTADRYLFCGYISTPEAVLACQYFNVNVKVGGSRISMIPSTQTGDSFTVGFDLVGFRYLWASTKTNVPTNYPIPGETYVFEYSFDVPTTIVMEFWFGQWSYAGAPTLTLPIGTTSGSYSFTWGADAAQGRWTLRAASSTPYTATGTFKIGNELC